MYTLLTAYRVHTECIRSAYLLWIESISNQMRIEFSFVNRTNSESNANRLLFCESNQFRIKCESSFVLWIEPTPNQMRIDFCFVNRINSESNANRVLFFESNQLRIKCESTFVLWIESIPNQMRIDQFFFVNRINSESTPNQLRIEPTQNQTVNRINTNQLQINSESNGESNQYFRKRKIIQ